MLSHFNIRGIELTFNILTDTLKPINFNLIEDICFSFDDSIIIDSSLPFEKLVIEQQKYTKYILSPSINSLVRIQLILRLIDNFLIVTKQHLSFNVERINMIIDDVELSAYGSEMFNGDISSLSFSPSIRTKWTDPQLFQEIITI